MRLMLDKFICPSDEREGQYFRCEPLDPDLPPFEQDPSFNVILRAVLPDGFVVTESSASGTAKQPLFFQESLFGLHENMRYTVGQDPK